MPTQNRQNMAGKARGWGCPVLGGEEVGKGFPEVVVPELNLKELFNTYARTRTSAPL